MSCSTPACPAQPCRDQDSQRPRASVDVGQPVDDQVVLRTISGAEDLLAEALATFGAVHRSDSRIIFRISGTLEELRDVRLYSSLAVPLAGSPGDEVFLASVRRSVGRGVLSALSTPGPLRFRLEIGTPAAAEVSVALEHALGWINDPGDWSVNFMRSPAGWEAEVGPFYWTRRFGRFERLPWSTKPVVAEILVRLAKLRPGQRILDPFCGTGTLLVTAGRLEPDVILLGSDQDPDAIDLARINFDRFGVTGRLDIAMAECIQHPDRSVDRMVANLPFGKLVGSHAGNGRLYPAALEEIARVLADDGRVVLMTDDKRLLKDAVMHTTGLKVVRERLLRYGGVTPTVFVLSRTRRRPDRGSGPLPG
ncbi:MAG TPA: methyltransferase domain-containing protein [Kribbella sp.]